MNAFEKDFQTLVLKASNQELYNISGLQHISGMGYPVLSLPILPSCWTNRA